MIIYFIFIFKKKRIFYEFSINNKTIRLYLLNFNHMFSIFWIRNMKWTPMIHELLNDQQLILNVHETMIENDRQNLYQVILMLDDNSIDYIFILIFNSSTCLNARKVSCNRIYNNLPNWWCCLCCWCMIRMIMFIRCVNYYFTIMRKNSVDLKITLTIFSVLWTLIYDLLSNFNFFSMFYR